MILLARKEVIIVLNQAVLVGRIVKEIAIMEGYEALKHIPTHNVDVQTPSAKVTAGSVWNVSVSHTTRDGCQKAPIRFLPAGILMAVLPPTEESTAARKVVGICMNRMPRK